MELTNSKNHNELLFTVTLIQGVLRNFYLMIILINNHYNYISQLKRKRKIAIHLVIHHHSHLHHNIHNIHNCSSFFFFTRFNLCILFYYVYCYYYFALCLIVTNDCYFTFGNFRERKRFSHPVITLKNFIDVVGLFLLYYLFTNLNDWNWHKPHDTEKKKKKRKKLYNSKHQQSLRPLPPSH